MCGRYLLEADYEALIERYGILDDFNALYEKKEEIFPGQSILAITHNGEFNERRSFIWGLKFTPKRILINSRIETVLNSKLYDRFRPCIIPASGYYEWENIHKRKMKITADSKIINLAGLFDLHSNTVSIITTEATPEMEWIHNRMPLVIEETEQDQWLKAVQLKKYLFHYDLKKTLKFSAENLESSTQLSFFSEDFFEKI
ncbi:SOS response-associated peptidase [Fusibacter ferrireducens]|uniref:Abasic site processing protein n=1 Tax=Fusibacter ferrireducens TaxID=2785058 RepID=A0ABR9ZRW5_9FIRM|nr:SOS response-associated peptidase [Fusibacter ferrireducens]MBF4693208.1 SOS response-associated peptidase [Fusibacter ferrireducens]